MFALNFINVFNKQKELDYNASEQNLTLQNNEDNKKDKDKHHIHEETCLFCQMYLFGLHESIQEDEVFNEFVQQLDIYCQKQSFIEPKVCFRKAVNNLYEYKLKDLTIKDAKKICKKLFLCKKCEHEEEEIEEEYPEYEEEYYEEFEEEYDIEYMEEYCEEEL